MHRPLVVVPSGKIRRGRSVRWISERAAGPEYKRASRTRTSSPLPFHNPISGGAYGLVLAAFNDVIKCSHLKVNLVSVPGCRVLGRPSMWHIEAIEQA
jgi:hypothetical protein